MNYSVLYVETTGLSPIQGDHTIEVGALSLKGKAITGEFFMVNAGRLISPHAHKINCITYAMLKDCPAPADVFSEPHRLIKGAILVAHNARFDLTFLWHEFKRLGLGLPNRHHCTFKLSRKLYPHLPSHQLDTVYQHLCGTIEKKTKRHRARDDVRMNQDGRLKR